MRRLNQIFDLGQKSGRTPPPEDASLANTTTYGDPYVGEPSDDTTSGYDLDTTDEDLDPKSTTADKRFSSNLPWRRQTDAQRRAKSINSRKWRQRASLTTLAVVAFVGIIGGFWAWTTGRLDVAKFQLQNSIDASLGSLGLQLEEFVLEGERRYTTKNQIRESLNTSRGEPILAVEPDVLRQRLMTLPWVKEAMVERILPNTIVVTLEERKPLAIWQFQGQKSLLDQAGQKVDVQDLDPFSNLPVLVGKEADAFAADFIHMVAKVNRVASKLKVAQLVNQRRWTLKLDNGILIHLPEENPLAALNRVANLDKTDSLLSKDVLEIDLRLADRMVVRTNSGADRNISTGASEELGAPT